MPDLASSIHYLSLMALPFLLAVTLHEAGHAFAAYYLGDKSQVAEGRLSLNPLNHIDPFGTVVIPIVAVLANLPFLIGYAKPVMIDPRPFQKLRRDLVLVAIAGPLGNVVVALFCAYMVRFALMFGAGPESWIVNTMVFGIYINCLFMVFNLLPIPPLDGAGIVEQFLPYEAAQKYRSIAPFGFMILMGVIILAPSVIMVPSSMMFGLIAYLVGVPV
ncbi:site-2 protease family protein [Gimibacter soli]|uniref:Site-2 protease family protein n=1 Tax=Gimibacter soli TaxID=3024400 RepID=A0AAF0BG31_9PROT|nr:site-2 protease family protein [Gimibacter soli]WCL53128.1 site-2 protease family protein [Gimibacter soli]